MGAIKVDTYNSDET